MLPRLSRNFRTTPMLLPRQAIVPRTIPVLRSPTIKPHTYFPNSQSRYISSSQPRSAQYKRFGGSGGPSKGGSGLALSNSTASTVIVCLGVLAGTYYVAQYAFMKDLFWLSLIMHIASHSLERVPETGRWRFMDVSPKYEAAVRYQLSGPWLTLALSPDILFHVASRVIQPASSAGISRSHAPT